MTPSRSIRRTRALPALLAALLAAALPAAAALTRPLTTLDGDAAVITQNSEDLLFTQQTPGRTTTEFGSALAFGDLNGDGLQDALIGQRTENKVFIYLGRTVPRAAAYFGDPGAADIVLVADAGTADAVQQFGFSVAAADLDRDGVDDIIVGAPFSDPGGRADQGLAYVVLGHGLLQAGDPFEGPLIIRMTAPPAGIGVVKLTRGAAGRAGDLLGFSVTGARSAALDEAWLVVSARGADATTPTLRTDAGAVHVARGTLLPAAGGVFDLAAGSTVTFYGEDASDALGEWVTTCDVDGAGEPDLLAGAIFGDGPANAGTNRGEALLWLGENIASGSLSGTLTAPSADLRIHGASNGDDFGYSMACGDLDGDGRGEIVAGSLFADGPGDLRPTSGEVAVLRGRASRLAGGRRELIDPSSGLAQGPIDLSVVPADLLLQGATTGDQLGFSVAVGDLDDDGFGDLIAGARLYDRSPSAPNTGALYLLAGSAAMLPAGAPRVLDLRVDSARDGLVVGATAEDNVGFAVVAGNLDGAGGDELMAGAIGDLSRAPGFRGEAYVLSFQDADGDAASDLIDQDNDNDGLTDDQEDLDGDGELDPGETDPRDPDTDGDLLQDGTERGVTCRGDGGVVEVDCDDPQNPYTSTDTSLPLHFIADADPLTVTDPRDRDSDDDGLADGSEDVGRDGLAAPGESDAANHDTDGDLVFDGTEMGRTAPLADTNLAAGHFVPDVDASASTTDPSDPDTDADGVSDGVEDADRNGAMAGDADLDAQWDPGELWLETHPGDDDTDRDGVPDGVEDADHDGAVDASESDPLDQDSDDDGLADGWIDGTNAEPLDGVRNALEGEDLDGNGVITSGESDPTTHDTDGDGITDGVESGLSTPGVPGRDGAPDTGPGQGGTDVTSPRFRLDADLKASRTDPTSSDTDGDLIPDGVEDADRDGAVAGDTDRDNLVDADEVWTETDADVPDTDEDGLDDGFEDADRDGQRDAGETSPLDQDSDDDGLPDGWVDGANGRPKDGVFQAAEGEDHDGDGVRAPVDLESDPTLADSDGDGILDGVEAGLTASGGVTGRNGVFDPGPGGDGTDRTSANFRADADAGATTTHPWDADTDDDGLPDGFLDGFNPNSGGAPGGTLDGMASAYEGEDLNGNGVVDAGETNPEFRDSDGDGVKDGAERGVLSPGVLGPDGVADPNSTVEDGTAGGLATEFDTQDSTLTNPLDADTDDDGLSDGAEDTSGNGAVDGAESDPLAHDTDGDLLFDGLEAGRVAGVAGGDTDTSAGRFMADADPASTTHPALADTDGGGAADGEEDADLNGRVDASERNPNLASDDDRTGVLVITDELGGPLAELVAGQALGLRLDDETDANLDPLLVEMVTVVCVAGGTNDQDIVTLAATAPDSAVFTGARVTAEGPAVPEDATLQVAPGSSVTCIYTDPQDSADVRTATIPVISSSAATTPDWIVLMESGGRITWQPAAPGAVPPGVRFNVHRGDPVVLAQTGVYTQQAAACGLDAAAWEDPAAPAPGAVVYYLVAGVTDGVEGPLGTDSAGRPRPSTEPCAR